MLTKDFLKGLLKEQKEKFLSRNTGIEREALSDNAEKLKIPHAVVITGIRRCGKSTFLTQIVKKYFTDQNFYYINFDDERWIGFEAKDFNLLYEALLELYGEARTFFIDEIQNIKGFEIFVRRFYDDGFKFFITGSNSDLLSSELGSRLTGRYVNINLYPFSFREFGYYKKLQFPENNIYTTNEKATFFRYFEEYLFTGGMPEYLIYKDDDSLKQIYYDIVIKDIAVRFNVNSLIPMRELYLFLITNSGKRFNYTSLSKSSGLQSTSTIINFISYLELTYFATQVRKFDFSFQKSQKNEKKLYVSDNGFVNLLSQSFTRDKGRLFENLVFNHLKTRGELFYYSDKNECDFICTINRKVTGAFQACYDLNDTNFERETSGLLEAMAYTGLGKGYILTLDKNEEIERNGLKISILPAWRWIHQDVL